MSKVCMIWSEWGRFGERSHLKKSKGGGLLCSLVLIIQKKIMETQFTFCNISFSCAIDLEIAMLWPRNEENCAFPDCEFSKVLVPCGQTSALYRIVQPTLTASFITFVCFTYTVAHCVIQLISALHLISRQRPDLCPGSISIPCKQERREPLANTVPCSSACSQKGCGCEGGTVTIIRNRGACCLLCVLRGEVLTTGILSVELHSP